MDDNEFPQKRMKKEEGLPTGKESKARGKSLMWFRTDLRISDNPALFNSFQNAAGAGVVAVFVIAEKEWRAHDLSPCKVDLMLRSLQTLKDELWNQYSIPLYIRYGSFLARKYEQYPPDQLPDDDSDDLPSTQCNSTPQILLKLCKETGATSLYFNKEYEIDEAIRDKHVSEYLTKRGIPVYSFHDQCVAPPGSILTKEQKPYTVFTPFRTSWYKWIEMNPQSLKLPPNPGKNSKPVAPIGDQVPSSLKDFEMSDPDYAANIRSLWPVGSDDVRQLLADFAKKRLNQYKDARDFPATKAVTPATSKDPNAKLITSGNQGIVTWISELCWRDFYRHVLFFFPRVCKCKPFKQASDYVKWRVDPDNFQRWCEGKTGYPIVDAGMRQLNTTGWMHNRVRMITAMFLTKDLLIDWRLGEAYFMKHLIDGDFASNNGGWQWSASTGTDAQPYFRVFNPALQSAKNDPSGEYIKRWVPELKSVDAKSIHEPFKTLSSAQFAKLGYPKPIIDHDFARKRAVETFKTAYAKEK